MEATVTFRDYQEEQSSDFNNLQAYAQQSFDDLVQDAVTTTLRYAGLAVSITGTAEVTVAPGRFYGTNTEGEVGAVYTMPEADIVSLLSYLAVTSQRYVTLVAYGVVNQDNQQTRNFLTNTQTGQTQPQVVSMEASRDVVLAIVAGSEAPTPMPPAVPTNQVAVANILLSTTGVVSVTQLTDNMVTSTEALNGRLALVEAFDAEVEIQVQTLNSDLSALAQEITNSSLQPIVYELVQDMALVKALLNLPSAYSEYGASYFLFMDVTQFDINNTQNLGFNCNIDNGIRFPFQNAADMALSMFNPLDPNGILNTSTGLLLPAYTEIVKVQTGTLPTQAGPASSTPAVIANTVALGQYGYQTFTQEQLNIPYTQIQNGGYFGTCTNGQTTLGGSFGNTISSSGTYPNNEPSYLPNFQSYNVVSGISFNDNTTADNWQDELHESTGYNFLNIETWTQPYWALESVQNTINGALIAQTILIGSDVWLTKIGLWFASLASQTSVTLTLTLTSNGQPDMTQVIAQGTIQGNALVAPGMNYLEIAPTFVQQGTRIAVVVTTMANHEVGLVATGSFTGGTFFYSLDGAYFLGDFQKDLAVQLWGCEFNSSQATVQLNSLNLEGGIRAIDLTARMQVPSACQLIFEVQPQGSSSWIPISTDDPLAPFQGAPVLANLRARFVGTPDIMPGLVLTNSLVIISCPGPAFTFVSMPETLATPSEHITVRFQVEHFNPTAHSIALKIYTGGPLTATNPTTTTTELIGADPTEVDENAGTYQVTATFTLGAAVSSFVIEASGTTNSVADVFLVANGVWWAT